MVDLGTLGGPSSFATAINAHGDVVGYSDLPGGGTHAFLWRHGRMRDLGTLPGGDISLASGINDRGEVTGRAVVDGRLVAFVWRAGVMTRLPDPSGAGASGNAINNRGQVAGNAHLDGTQPFPVLWRAAGAIALGTGSGEASAINVAGDVAGDFFAGSQQAFLWRRGRFVALPSPAGAEIAVGTGINDRADVVGFGLGAGRQTAALWPRGRRPVTLPGLAPGGQNAAYDIDNRGRIVGLSEPVPGQGYHAVRWIPR
jgi:probable HAF family extracellular repeat protein